MSAQKKWHKFDGQNRLPAIIQGIEFRDWIRHIKFVTPDHASPTFAHIAFAHRS